MIQNDDSPRVATPAIVVALVFLALALAVATARATVPGANGVIAFNTCQSGAFGTVNPDGSGLAELPLWSGPQETSFLPLAFSPDGNTVLIAHKVGDPPAGSGLNQYALYATPLDGSAPRRLPTGAGSAYDAAWSPDGTRIAYITNRDTPPGTLQGELYVLDLATGVSRRLTTDGLYETHPDWAPDGSLIAVEAGSQHDDILVVDPVSGVVTNLTNTPSTDDLDPSWAPDSARIAFSRRAGGSGSQITTMARNGTDLRPLTGAGYNDRFPVWSPDGTRIAYDHPLAPASAFGGFGNLMTMRSADGGDQRDLTHYSFSAPRFACPTGWQACRQGVTKRCTSPLIERAAAPQPTPTPPRGGGGGPDSADTRPPVARFSGRAVYRRGIVRARLSCNEPCRVVLKGRLFVRGVRKPLRAPAVRRRLAARTPRTVAFHFPRRRVGARRMLQLVVSISAVDAAGNRSSRLAGTRVRRR